MFIDKIVRWHLECYYVLQKKSPLDGSKAMWKSVLHTNKNSNFQKRFLFMDTIIASTN